MPLLNQLRNDSHGLVVLAFQARAQTLNRLPRMTSLFATPEVHQVINKKSVEPIERPRKQVRGSLALRFKLNAAPPKSFFHDIASPSDSATTVH